MTVKKTFTKRLVAGAGAFALATAGLVAFGSPAYAAVGPDQPGAPEAGTLTINKYSGAPVGEGGTPDAENLLDGVQFTVTQVGRTVDGTCVPVDLTVADDWDGLEGLFASAPEAPASPFCELTGDAVHSGVTENGQVVFPLDVGIYFVQETDPGDNNIVSPVPNFYVSIPTSVGAGEDGWNYDVVADPKNQLMEAPSKTIDGDQTDLILGSDVTWTLSVPVPTLNNDETFDEAVITDTLDERLKYVAGSSTVTVGETELDEGTHYNVDGNAVWTLTDAGLLVLDENMGEALTIVFDTTVESVGDGIIPNDDYESTFNGTTVPGEPTPYTYWGELSILKTDDSSPVNNLAGAEFKVFDLAEGEVCAADAPTAGEVATGTSGDDGVVVWDFTDPASSPLGLWIANVNDGPAAPAPTKDYCVYETVVPAGHTATPIENPVTIRPGENGLNNLTVVNPKKEGPDLPLTGAQGTMLMTAAGLAVIAVGAALVVVSRRRKNNQVA